MWQWIRMVCLGGVNYVVLTSHLPSYLFSITKAPCYVFLEILQRKCKLQQWLNGAKLLFSMFSFTDQKKGTLERKLLIDICICIMRDLINKQI